MLFVAEHQAELNLHFTKSVHCMYLKKNSVCTCLVMSGDRNQNQVLLSQISVHFLYMATDVVTTG